MNTDSRLAKLRKAVADAYYRCETLEYAHDTFYIIWLERKDNLMDAGKPEALRKEFAIVYSEMKKKARNDYTKALDLLMQEFPKALDDGGDDALHPTYGSGYLYMSDLSTGYNSVADILDLYYPR